MNERAEQAAHVSAWRESGQSAVDYSAAQGLKLSSLRYWSTKFKRKAGAGLKQAVEAASGTRLALVRRRGRPPGSTSVGTDGAPLRVRLGEVSVDVPSGFDAETLRRVLDVLSGGGR